MDEKFTSTSVQHHLTEDHMGLLLNFTQIEGMNMHRIMQRATFCYFFSLLLNVFSITGLRFGCSAAAGSDSSSAGLYALFSQWKQRAQAELHQIPEEQKGVSKPIAMSCVEKHHGSAAKLLFKVILG